MVIVPSLAKRDDGHKKVVPAIVFGLETAFPEDMREGINRERSMIEEHGADEEAPDQQLPPGSTQTRRVALQQRSQRKCGGCQQDGRQRVIPVEQTQVAILNQVGDKRTVGRLTLAGQKPPDV